MALIDYKDYFDFDAFEKAIKNLETTSGAFGQTFISILARAQAELKATTDVMQQNVATLKNFNINQKDAVDTLTKMATENDKLIEKHRQQKRTVEDITAATNFLNKSVTELKNTQSTLEKEYNSLGNVEQKDITRKKEILDIIQRIVPAINTQNDSLKNAKKVVDAADNSYRAMQNELKQVGAQLRALPNAFDPVTGKLNKQNKEAAALHDRYLQLSTSLKTADAGMGIFFRNVGNYEGAVGKLTAGIGHFASSLLLAVGIVPGLFGLVQFLEQSTEKFNEEQIALTQLQNILKNVGREDAFDRLREKAHALSEEFKTFEDKDVINVFQKLIQYGKLTENQIDQLIPVIINFATITGQSLEEATATLLKSLEGNNRGLKQFGINIRDAKNTTEAFGLVMNELAPRVENAAKAFGDTTAGQIKKTEVQIEELKEEIGGKLQPAIQLFYKTISGGIDGVKIIFENVVGFTSTLIASIRNANGVIKDLLSFDFGGAAKKIADNRVEAAKSQYEQEITTQHTVAAQNALNIAQEASTKPLKEQEKLLESNKAILEKSKAKALEINKANKERTAEGIAATKNLIQDLQVVQKLEESIAAQKNKSILGLGDPNDPFSPKSSKEKQSEFDKQIKLQQDAAQKELELQVSKNEQILIQTKATNQQLLQDHKINSEQQNALDANAEVQFLKLKYDLTKQTGEKIITLEHERGVSAEQSKIQDVKKTEQDVFNAYLQAKNKEDAREYQLDIETQKQAVKAKTDLQLAALKQQHDTEIITEEKTAYTKLLIEKKYLDAVDNLLLASLQKQLALETDITKQKELQHQIDLLNAGKTNRTETFKREAPAAFEGLGEDFLNKEFEKKQQLGKATIADEIKLNHDLIELRTNLVREQYQTELDGLEQLRALHEKNGESTVADDEKIGALKVKIALETYNKTKDLQEKQVIATKEFQEQVFSLLQDSISQLNSVLGSSMTNFLNEILIAFKTIKKDSTFKDTVEEWGKLADAAAQAITASFIQGSEARIAQYQVEKDHELEIAGSNTDAQAAIEKQYQRKVAVEKRKEAIANKVSSLFQIAINTAVAVTKVAAQTGVISPLLIPAIIALGALEAGLVIAQPIPKFAKGGTATKDTYALVDEIGSELIVDKHGNLKEVGSNKGARLTYLNTGDKVITHQKTKEIFDKEKTNNYTNTTKTTLNKTLSFFTEKETQNTLKAKDYFLTEREIQNTITRNNFLREQETLEKLSYTIQHGKHEQMVDAFASAIKMGSNDKGFDKVVHAVKSLPIQINNFDERGYTTAIKQGNNLTTHLNSYSWRKK